MKILVLFKTHLDIGFTDFSANVVRMYNEQYIPQAISVAEEIAASGRPEGFVWTVGSWLIAQYMKTADEEHRERLDHAIRSGWVSWHGLPFTLHTEICSAELYEYGLSFSKELDRQFGTKTISAKCTDAPGHTASVIPHLADSGIRFLHMGVNPASTCVDVPAVFRWSFMGRSINIMYNGDYGEFTRIPHTDTYVYFAHTGDNLGPQSAEDVIRVYEEIHKDYPGAEVRAGTLNDVAAEIAKVEDKLPLVTGEMGDTWIHGAASDPKKLAQYKAMLRLCAGLDERERQEAYWHLLMIPEHTWGLDEKTFLHENKNYLRPLFGRARDKYNYKIMELSWAEQRKYVLDAAECVADREAAEVALDEFCTELPDFSALTPLEGREAALNGLHLSFSGTGAIESLFWETKGVRLDECELFGFSYDEYSFDEVWNFCTEYLRPSFIEDLVVRGNENWAINDFGKYGLQHERNEHTASVPLNFRLYTDGNSLYVDYGLDREIVGRHGLPEKCLLRITPEEGRILFDFSWYGKSANRAPEALWLSFNPGRRLRGISKLGYVIDPSDVLDHGGKGLHSTDGSVFFEGLAVELLDSALVSVGGKNICRFVTENPDMESGVYFNLYNNQWGTNFPTWYEGDGRARFVLSVNSEPYGG